MGQLAAVAHGMVLQRVLELGCGCGVTGLVAARWARHVTLTDAEPEVTIWLAGWLAG